MGVVRFIGKSIKIAVFGVVALVALIVVIAAVGLGSAANKDAKQGKEVTAKIGQVHLGMTQAQVRAILGKPESTQRMQTSGLTDVEWYYGTLSKNDWQLSFENGKLSSKNRY